jgi:phage shock protein PspC (stress-responsive transcriptional regulator)
MKKNINVNISGLLFNIDEDAFAALQNYLERLKHHFGDDESGREIINDIESRIAEMMQEKLSDYKSVITIEDVQEIIKQMGEPGEIEEETEFEGSSKQTAPPPPPYQENFSGKRKLYRDPDDKIVGGVSSGLGHYFGIAPVWIRLAFVALTFFGMSVLVYIILWIVIPEARTTAQKLEMRGEPVTIENIERAIREEFNNMGEKFNEFTDKHFKKKSNEPNIFERLADVIVSIIGLAFKILLVIVGGTLALAAILILLVLIPSFFHTGSLFIYTFPGIHSVSVFNMANLLFPGEYISTMAFVGLIMVVFIPLIAIIYYGGRMLFNYRGHSGMGTTFFIIWITGVVLLILSGSQLANDMDNRAEVKMELPLNYLQNDTLYVQLDRAYYNKINLNDYMDDKQGFQFYANDHFFFIPPRVYLNRLDSNEEALIHIKRSSRAGSYRQAKELAEHIYFPFRIKGDTLIIPPLFRVPRADKWRNPKVRVELDIPEGINVKYLDIDSDDPILCGIQEDFNYRLRIDDDDVSVKMDSNGLYIKTDDKELILNNDSIVVHDAK